MEVIIREYRDGDGAAIVQISRENARYYAELAPDYFKVPDEEGFIDLFKNDGKWRNAPESLALVAEVDGRVTGYLEATHSDGKVAVPARPQPPTPRDQRRMDQRRVQAKRRWDSVG